MRYAVRTIFKKKLLGIFFITLIPSRSLLALCNGSYDARSFDRGLRQRKSQSFPWKDLVLWIDLRVTKSTLLSTLPKLLLLPTHQQLIGDHFVVINWVIIIIFELDFCWWIFIFAWIYRGFFIIFICCILFTNYLYIY